MKFTIILIGVLFFISSTTAQTKQDSLKSANYISSNLRFDKCHGINLGAAYWGVLDENNNLIGDYVSHIYPVKDTKTKFNNGLALVQREQGSNEMSYMFADGEHLNDFDILGYAREFNEGYAAYCKRNSLKFGIINIRNEEILPFEYKDITSICNKRCFVQNNSNKWALFNVETKKFMTDFKYSWIDYAFPDSYNKKFLEEIIVADINNVKLVLNVLSGIEREYNSCTTRIPNTKGYYISKHEKYFLWENANNSKVRFKFWNDSSYGFQKYIHPNLIEARKDGKACLLDSNGTRVSPLYYGIEWLDFNPEEFNPNLPRYIQVYSKKKDELLVGIYDLYLRKEIIAPIYKFVALHSSSPTYFRALKGNKHFLLDSIGANKLDDFIQANSIPYYINQQANICIIASINPDLPITSTKYSLCDLKGKKIMEEEFYSFTIEGNDIKIYDKKYNIETKSFENSSDNKSYNPEKPQFYSVSNKAIYFKDYYVLRNKNGNNLITDPIIQYTYVNDNLCILYCLMNGETKTGIYDLKNSKWHKIITESSEYDFTASNIYIKYLKRNIVTIGKKGEKLKLIDLNKNSEINGLEIIEVGDWGDNLLNVRFLNGKCGYIDSTLSIVIEPQFEDAYVFLDGYAGARIKSENSSYYVIIDKSGEIQYGDINFTNRTLTYCPNNNVSEMECRLESISTSSLNKTVYTLICNGKIGIKKYFNWSEFHAQQNHGKKKFNSKCKICHGNGYYIFQESCNYCNGMGVIYGEYKSEVIRSGGVRTEYQNGGNIQSTYYDKPVISQTRTQTNCNHCNGTGNNTNSFQFKDCWKCHK